MKNQVLLYFFSLLFLFSCGSKRNSEDFILEFSGRYIFNSNEIVEVYFENTELYLKWRGAQKIKPLKINDTTFFVKEMNEKIQFTNNKGVNYISVVPKEENEKIGFDYRQLKNDEKIPSEYLSNNQFDNALEAYLLIKQKDSLDPVLNESDINSLGYKHIRSKEFNKAINILKINVALHPESSNVYDSLGEAYMKGGDTINALSNYKKSLTLDSGNRRAKRMIERMQTKKSK